MSVDGTEHNCGGDRSRMYLVDGNNLMGQRVGWHRDKAAAQARLLEELVCMAASVRCRLAVVFEAQSDVRLSDASSHTGVSVYYARPGSNADNRIVELVRCHPSSSELAVVTSDRELARRVRDLGAAVIRSGVFRRMLGTV